MTTKFIRLNESPQQNLRLLQFQNKIRKDQGLSTDTAEALTARAQDLLATIKAAEENVDLIISSAAERHVIVWGHFLASLLHSANQPALFLNFAKILSANTNAPITRLQILQSIYNALPDSFPERYEFYCIIVIFATQTKQANVVIGTFPHISSLIQSGSWQVITPEQKRNIHLLMYNALISLGLQLKAYTTLVERLATYSPDEVKSGVATDLAVSAALLAIRLPEVHQCDELLALGPIAHLADHAEHATLHKLLSLFARDDLSGYLAFYEAHKASLTKLGLSHEECLQKIRLLTLNSIASHSRVLTYEAIARSLQISHEEVEDWIVLAVSNKLLDAKMDQIQSTVTVNQTNQRIFNIAQWQDLSHRLHLWRQNVSQCAVAFAQLKGSH